MYTVSIVEFHQRVSDFYKRRSCASSWKNVLQLGYIYVLKHHSFDVWYMYSYMRVSDPLELELLELSREY